jgi:hypothetical protein
MTRYLLVLVCLAAGLGAEMTRSETEALVKRDLADRLKVDAARLQVISASDQTWPDSLLGCGGRKGLVEPAPVPGFAFTLTYEGKKYEYHSDRNGKIKRCEAGKPKAETRNPRH